MITTRTTWVALGALGASLVAVPGVATAADDGKKVFEEHKCNECHTVESQGVERTKKKKKDMDPPDLSDVASRHDRDWMAKFIKKEVELDGKKHKKKFRGDAAEEKALLDWLASLKKK